MYDINSASLHHNNIHELATEMYKVTNGMSPELMNEVFKQTITIIMKGIFDNFINPAQFPTYNKSFWKPDM